MPVLIANDYYLTCQALGGNSGGTPCLRNCNYNTWPYNQYCCIYAKSGAGSGGRIRTYPYTYGNKVLIYNRDVSAGTSGQAAEAGTLCEMGNEFCSGNGEWNEVLGICTCGDGYSGNDCQYSCDPSEVSVDVMTMFSLLFDNLPFD